MEGRTQRNSPVSSGNRELDRLLSDLAGDSQAALPGLVDQDDALDAVAKAASQINEKRRARGRPEGSANRRNAEMFDYLEARGFKAPEVRLMEIISADTRDLADALGLHDAEYRLDVLKLQAKCAEALMPYKFAKRQELKIQHDKRELHVFMPAPLTRPGDVMAGAYDLTGGAEQYQSLARETKNSKSYASMNTVADQQLDPQKQLIENQQDDVGNSPAG